MKKFLLILTLGSSMVLNSQAQSKKLSLSELENEIENMGTDMVGQKNDIQRLEFEVKDINLRLNEYTENYFNGINLILIGAVINGVGGIILMNDVVKENTVLSVTCLTVGATLSLTGTIKSIMSHRKLKSDM